MTVLVSSHVEEVRRCIAIYVIMHLCVMFCRVEVIATVLHQRDVVTVSIVAVGSQER